jgi:hypothetical protein
VAESEEPGAVLPAVLDQALGSVLMTGEQVVCAAFVASYEGRLLRCEADRKEAPQLVAVTDRRFIKTMAWFQSWSADLLDEIPETGAMAAWRDGELLSRGLITHRFLWLGELRQVEAVLKTGQALGLGEDLTLSPFRTEEGALILHTSDGGRETFRAHGAITIRLESAVRAVLAGPGRNARPPQRQSSPKRRGWAARMAALLWQDP